MILRHDAYTVAWIYGLQLELAAAKVMLDEVHPPLPQPASDHNKYTLGSIGGHNVVMVCLPAPYTASVPSAVSQLRSTYRNIQFGLMVGIGGGVPHEDPDIRLGDIVVSKPTGTSSGVVLYEYGKSFQSGQLHRTGSINTPPPSLLKVIFQIESDYMLGKAPISNILTSTLQKESAQNRFSQPLKDELFQSTYSHAGGRPDCATCDRSYLVDRPERVVKEPHIHYGLIASGDQVMKDARARDLIAQEPNILCFEMGAVGVMDEIPSLVIRGICDYCDSHKHEEWQPYAAFVAAAYAKAVLMKLPFQEQRGNLGKSMPAEGHWMVPFQRNPGFAGREAEIAEVEELFGRTDGPSKVALCGLGGIGKTQIALELAYRVRGRDPKCSIFWIPCSSSTSVEQAYMGIAQTVGFQGVKPADVKERVNTYFSQAGIQKWLLIFDDADDMDMWVGDSGRANLLPQSEHGRILFTTRNRGLAVELASPFVIEVSLPDPETGIGRQRLDSLSTMGSLASTYRSQGRWKEAEDLELQALETYKDTLGLEHPKTIASMRGLASIYQIQGRWKEAEDLELQVLETLKEVLGSEHPDSLGSMANLASIFRNQRRWKEGEDLELQVLETLKEVLGSEHPETLTSMRGLALTYQMQGRWKEAEDLELQVLETLKEVLGPEHPDSLASMANLASIFRNQRRWKEAEGLELQVLWIRWKVLGPDHPDTLTSMHGLASTYMNIGRVKESEELLLHAWEIQQRPSHPYAQATADKLLSLSGFLQKLLNMAKFAPSAEYPQSSVGSLPQSSIFDIRNKAGGTIPSSMDATTLPTGLSAKSSIAPISTSPSSSDSPENSGGVINSDMSNVECHEAGSDSETICSIDSGPNDRKLRHIEIFANRLRYDIENVPEFSGLSNMPYSYLEPILKDFVWKLHGESSNPFQWEAAVILRQKMKEIIDLLSSASLYAGDEPETDGESTSEYMGEEGNLERSLANEPPDIRSWIDEIELSSLTFQNVDASHTTIEDEPLHLLPDYETFISESDAYQWLLCKLRQRGQLELKNPISMCRIGMKIRDELRAQEVFRKISRRRSSLVTMRFDIDWNPVLYFQDQGTPLISILEKTLSLTGTSTEAQAATVVEYLRQTWPVTGEHTINLMKQLFNLPAGEEVIYQPPRPSGLQMKAAYTQTTFSCSISVTGSPYLVSELAEQIAWLASTLRVPPISQGIVSCTPRVEDIKIEIAGKRPSEPVLEGTCRIVFDFEEAAVSHDTSCGFCWAALFSKAILVSGYPIPRRPEANTGLELSLSTMAYLNQSRQVVQLGEKIVLKGFSSLLVATLASAGIVVWHLLLSRDPDERISYIDPRLDSLNVNVSDQVSLRGLEGSRHIVGWCTSAAEFCGHPKANHNISASGLPNLPASIVIDRLYIEAGSNIIGGLNMSINKKAEPSWLARESTYPKLIEWIGLQAVMFYDVSQRRSWLVDGVSAVLHLVRVSLHRHEHNKYSPYEWLYDPTKLNDNWGDCTGYFAALKTLTDWHNLSLGLYVKEKKGDELRVSTFGEEVERLLHSFEIIIETQTKFGSQDGVRIFQTLNPRKSIVGFDILDVIDPLGPVQMRIRQLDFGTRGWVDLVPAIGGTTIFGHGFGELIRPNNPQTLCNYWSSVPTGMDYMATSVSTVKMLYERRLLRLKPDLGIGEMTSKIIWVTRSHPFESCKCLKPGPLREDHHSELVHFLVPRRLLWQKDFIPVDIKKLEETAAVVFGHSPMMGWKRQGKVANALDESEGSNTPVTSNSTQDDYNISTVFSAEAQSTGSTAITIPSHEPSLEPESGRSNVRKGKWKSNLKNWTKKWSLD